MPGAAPQGGNQGDNSAGMLWGIAAVFAALGAIWYVFKDPIIAFYLAIKVYELDLMGIISKYVLHNPAYFDQVKQVVLYYRYNPAKAKFSDILLIGNSVGDWLRYPCVVILVLLAIAVYVGNAARV